MGKVYKRKRRSCALCKPHKMGGADRLTPKERAKTKEAEKEMYAGMAELVDAEDFNVGVP